MMTTMKNALAKALAACVALMPSTPVFADPCGMVPPIWIGKGNPIERVGLQRTYVFYKDGVETMVLRPGFDGKVDEFGMLIPFPSPPAIRKVADDVFDHLGAAIDPPEVVVDLRMRYLSCDMVASPRAKLSAGLSVRQVNEEKVTVVSREAVGMYEVAVLEAGSAAALKLWMDEHGFRYPEGMDATCEEYVDDGWCFVAVKARVGQHAGSQAKPGLREVDVDLPAGAGFDGHVQAMGFRFRTDELVVPMRLSAFNPGELHNVVYALTEGPTRIANLPASYVKRQIPGWQLYRNLTNPLPLRVLGGGLNDIPDWRRQNLPAERDPIAHNGIARELFASDLLAARTGSLSHELEEREKELLDIGERLGLHGPELDALHHQALAADKEAMIEQALADLEGMTLTVIDADFPREVLAAANLTFSDYTMSARKNNSERYDARLAGPAPRDSDVWGGILTRELLSDLDSGQGPTLPPGNLAFLGLLALAAFALKQRRAALPAGPRSPGRRTPSPRLAAAAVCATASLGLWTLAAPARAIPQSDEPGFAEALDAKSIALLMTDRNALAESLVAEAMHGDSIASRGWAVVALAQAGQTRALEAISLESESALVKTWALAGLASKADAKALAQLGQRTMELPATLRPVRLRWLELLANSDVELELVLEAIAPVWNLQQELLPLLLDRSTAEFARIATSGRTDQSRNLAAGVLATQAQQGRTDVELEVLRTLAFNPDARTVPWSGGALFLPGLAWDKETGAALMRELIAWHVWCERRGLTEQQRQIDRNLNSWSLANTLGFDMPGGTVSASRWLDIYREVAGREALGELLEELGSSRER